MHVRSKQRRVRVAVVVTFVALIAASCSQEDNTIPLVEIEDRIVASVFSTDDPARYVVNWFVAPCEEFREVQVTSDDDFVNLRVRVQVDPTACPDNSPGTTIVSFGDPLGDRRIFDLATNNTVALDA